MEWKLLVGLWFKVPLLPAILLLAPDGSHFLAFVMVMRRSTAGVVRESMQTNTARDGCPSYKMS